MARSTTKPLSIKESRFVLAYLGPCRGNALQAALRAGYAKGSAGVTGYQLLRKPHVRAYVERRKEAEATLARADAKERDEILSNIARQEDHDVHARVAAVRELNKVDGRHSSTLHVSGRLTLEEGLGISRQGDGQ